MMPSAPAPLRLVLLPLLALSSSLLPAVAAKHGNNLFVANTLVVPRSTVAEPAAAAAETLLRDDRILLMQHGQWTYLSQQEAAELRRRDDVGTAVTTAAATTATTSTSTAKTTTAKTSTAATTSAASLSSASGSGSTQSTSTTSTKTTSSSPLPSFLDSSLASNFTTDSSCPAFINSFLTNPNFKKCYPFSLLLQGSRSFFEAEKSLVSITQVLDATCAANATFCATYLSGLASNLTSPSNCGPDYKLGNSIVVQAYMGMLAYQPLYSASCLQDPSTSSYCFANAITNLSTPANVYFYYLPLNISLPNSSVPSCNWCLHQTMNVFWAAAANRKQFIANTYLAAASQVDTICGASFVNDSLPIAIKASAAVAALSQSLSMSLHWVAPALFLSVAAQLLLF